MSLNLGDIDACVQDLIDLTEDYKQLEVLSNSVPTFIKVIIIEFFSGKP